MNPQEENRQTPEEGDAAAEADAAAAREAGEAGPTAKAAEAGATETEAATEETAEQEVDPRDAEIADLKDKLLRAVAETENVRRRAAREKEEAHKFAISNFAKDLCDVADNLQRAVEAVPAEKAEDAIVKTLVEGVEMTERTMLGAFERHGIRRIDPQGEKFDPNLHEAMTEVEDPSAEPGTVIQVFQTGYMISDRLLRPARVVVAKGGEKQQGAKVDTVA